MNFEECVKRVINHGEFLEVYDKLRGTNLSLKGNQIDLMIDQNSGRLNSEFNDFLEFVYEYVWVPILLEP